MSSNDVFHIWVYAKDFSENTVQMSVWNRILDAAAPESGKIVTRIASIQNWKTLFDFMRTLFVHFAPVHLKRNQKVLSCCWKLEPPPLSGPWAWNAPGKEILRVHFHSKTFKIRYCILLSVLRNRSHPLLSSPFLRSSRLRTQFRDGGCFPPKTDRVVVREKWPSSAY